MEMPGGAIYDALLELLQGYYRMQEPGQGQGSEAAVQQSAAPAAGAIAGAGPLCNEDGTINARTMAALIFSHGELLEKVNALVHPAVWDFVNDRIRAEKEKGAAEYFILEAALLIECGYRAIVDEMWYIHCDAAVRRARLKESRGYSDEKIDSIMRSQLSEEAFKAGTDYCIDNSGALDKAFSQIRERMQDIAARERTEQAV